MTKLNFQHHSLQCGNVILGYDNQKSQKNSMKYEIFCNIINVFTVTLISLWTLAELKYTFFQKKKGNKQTFELEALLNTEIMG